jgi:hypothetical protein
MSEQFDARLPLSVLVPVKNEAANLRDGLASISFAYEIVVVGFRDGYRGWVLCRLLASYERMIELKERELKDRLSNSSAVSYTL